MHSIKYTQEKGNVSNSHLLRAKYNYLNLTKIYANKNDYNFCFVFSRNKASYGRSVQVNINK